MIKKILFSSFSFPMIVLFFLFIFSFFNIQHIQLDWHYLIDESLKSGKAGGIGPMVVSTVVMTIVASLIALPLSFCVALYLFFYLKNHNFFFSLVDILLSLLTGIPSIVFGLFGNAFFVVYLKMGYSLLAGSLTLVCMVLPTCSKLIYDHLKMIPSDYFFASEAVNLSFLKVIKYVILPLSSFSLLSAFSFSISRALSETAALLFTSGYVDRMPHSLMDSGRSISVHIYDLALNIPGGDKAAFKASFVFLLLALMISLGVNFILKKRGVGTI